MLVCVFVDVFVRGAGTKQVMKKEGIEPSIGEKGNKMEPAGVFVRWAVTKKNQEE